jgi:hypothetical protein
VQVLEYDKQRLLGAFPLEYGSESPEQVCPVSLSWRSSVTGGRVDLHQSRNGVGVPASQASGH